MAEPKKETVRIALPPRRDEMGASASKEKQETVRIVLPSRTPPVAVRRSPPTILPKPVNADSPAEAPLISLRRPPVAPATIAAASDILQPLPKPPGVEDPSIQPGPKKETARILPQPSAGVNMSKTQPLLIHPASGVHTPRINVATSGASDPFASIPKSFCWGLLGISALIFLIQIWNYVVS